MKKILLLLCLSAVFAETTDVQDVQSTPVPNEINQKVKITTEKTTKLVSIYPSTYDYVKHLATENKYRLYWESDFFNPLNPADSYLNDDFYKENHEWKAKVAKSIQDLNKNFGSANYGTQLIAYDCGNKLIVTSQNNAFKAFSRYKATDCMALATVTETKMYLPSGKEYKVGDQIKTEDVIPKTTETETLNPTESSVQ